MPNVPVFELLQLVMGQASPVPSDTAMPLGTVGLLQAYGGWGVAVILGGTVIALAKAYKLARDNETSTVKEQNRELIALTVKSTEANLELKTALTSVASAMQSMERRLEDVERGIADHR